MTKADRKYLVEYHATRFIMANLLHAQRTAAKEDLNEWGELHEDVAAFIEEFRSKMYHKHKMAIMRYRHRTGHHPHERKTTSDTR